jgi:dihydroflavonol-4-reductase
MFAELSVLTGLPAPTVKMPKAVVRIVAEISEFIADNITRKEPLAAVEQALHLRYEEFVDCSKAVKELGLPQNDIRIAMLKAIKYYIETGAVLPRQMAKIRLKELN